MTQSKEDQGGSDRIGKTRVLEREKEFHNHRYETGSESRKAANKYYTLKKDLDRRYMELIRRHAGGRKVLEIGCGPNINTLHWMDVASESHAIDVSDVAISQAKQALAGKKGNVRLTVMNAEAMDYDEDSFDVVCGKGIIHHLNVETAWKEVARILKPDGVGVFIEPLGHNPVINTYRRLTPEMRSEDEHPLRMADVRSATGYFDRVDVEYQHITTLLSVFMPGRLMKTVAFSLLKGLDQGLMRMLPFTKKYCWMALICLRNPKSRSL